MMHPKIFQYFCSGLIFFAILNVQSHINPVFSQEDSLKLYPSLYDYRPDIASPKLLPDGSETILVKTKNGKFGILPVTVENGKPLHYSYSMGTHMGKGLQLHIDVGDFPELGRSGLHDNEQLDNKERITGIPVGVINCTAVPDGYSLAGFIAGDEDIISVLKGDNLLVAGLDLTHAELARPLFHMWGWRIFSH